MANEKQHLTSKFRFTPCKILSCILSDMTTTNNVQLHYKAVESDSKGVEVLCEVEKLSESEIK